jgi:lipoprotein-anchoring transpeptidase ErfK/SrfK
MLTRRNLLLGGLAAAASLPVVQAEAHHTKAFKANFKLDPRYKPQTVRYSRKYAPGTIVVEPRKHFLYLIEQRGQARRYGVGVGRAGLAFKGSAIVQRKAKWPR